jgi:hypothetical protein
LLRKSFNFLKHNSTPSSCVFPHVQVEGVVVVVSLVMAVEVVEGGMVVVVGHSGGG